MSDAMMAEIKSLGTNLARIDEAMTQKLDPLQGELKSMKDAIAEMQLRTQKFEFLNGAKSKNVSPKMKSFIDYVAGRTNEIESKANTATVANQNNAGYLAIPEFIDQVIPQLYDRSPLLSEITVFRISGNLGSIPVANSRPDVHWVGETETRPVSKVDLGVANIPLNEMVCSTELSNVLIRDSNLVNAEQYIQSESASAMRDGIGTAILTGDGDCKPIGLMNKDAKVNKKIKALKSGAATGITTDVLFDAMGSLKNEAMDNAKWVMSNSTFWAIAKQFGKDSSYVTMPLAEGIRPAILGKPVVICDAPGLGTTGNRAIMLGDLRRAYIGVQSEQMTFLRDPYTKSMNGITRMTYNTAFGGQVVRPETLVAIDVGA